MQRPRSVAFWTYRFGERAKRPSVGIRELGEVTEAESFRSATCPAACLSKGSLDVVC
jgi:hypothetical protein